MSASSSATKDAEKLQNFRRDVAELTNYVNITTTLDEQELYRHDVHVLGLVCRKKEIEVERLDARLIKKRAQDMVTQFEQGLDGSSEWADMASKDAAIEKYKSVIQNQQAIMNAATEEIFTTMQKEQEVLREFERHLYRYGGSGGSGAAKNGPVESLKILVTKVRELTEKLRGE